MIRAGILLVAASICTMMGDAARGQCPSAWSDRFGVTDHDYAYEVRSLVVFDDDGDGPNPPMLYAGGSFTEIGGAESSSGIARWDGKKWSSVGGGIQAGFLNGVYCMKVFDADGPGPGTAVLVVGGSFQTVGGQSIQNIAQWNGSSWTPLQAGANDIVRALEVFDDDGDGPNTPALFAGGSFTAIGNTPARNIAKYQNNSWQACDNGLEQHSETNALAVFDEDGDGPQLAQLFVGGFYHNAKMIADSSVKKWNGTSWTTIGPGFSAPVRCLTVHDDDGPGPHAPALYAGGEFIYGSSNHIAKWDGVSWSGVGTGTSNNVYTLASVKFQDNGTASPILIAGGSTYVMSLWDGANWTFENCPPSLYGISALLMFKEPNCDDRASLFVGGSSGPYPEGGIGSIAKFDGSQWSPLRSGLNGIAYALAVVDLDKAGPDSPALFVGGEFTYAGTGRESSLALWSGDCWSTLPEPILGEVHAIAARDEPNTGVPTLYVGGFDLSAAGTPMGGLVKWNGTNWSDVGQEFPYAVYAMTSYDNDAEGSLPSGLYIGGNFSIWPDNQEESVSIVRWNGTEFATIPNLFGTVYAMIVFDDDGPGPDRPSLYVGGNLSAWQENGEWIDTLAKWDGTSWSSAGFPSQTSNDEVRALCVFDADGDGPVPPRLIAGGRFSNLNGVSASNVAQWYNGTWSPLGAGVNNTIHVLSCFDQDSDGPRRPILYAGGDFTIAGDRPANGIAQWDGAVWTHLESGLVNGSAYALTSFDDDGDGSGLPALYVGGAFHIAGGHSSGRIARWDPQYQAPAWFEDPQNRSATVGNRTVFTAYANGGEPLEYQWQKDGVPLSDGPSLYGTTTPMLVIQSVSSLDEGNYALQATNGCSASVSLSAHLTVCIGEPNGDINSDGVVNGQDIRYFVEESLSAAISSEVVCRADADRNGVVDAGDLAYFVSNLLAD